MKCIVCRHGETVPGKISLTFERGKTLVVFRNIPTEICSNCGESYIDVGITQHLTQKAQEAAADGIQVIVREYEEELV